MPHLKEVSHAMKLRDVQACLRASITDRASAVGPFLVLLDKKSDNPFLNYAVPVDGAAPTSDDITALIEFFTSSDRMPRLEYVRPAPAVDVPLTDAGFDVAATLTLMAVGQPTDVPDVPGYRVRLVEDEDSSRLAVGVQNTAYGEPPGEPDPTGVLRTVRAGGCCALVVTEDTGTPAGAGLFTSPRGGLVEVAGIGVLAEHRRHGVGRLVAAALTAEALRRRHEPFLQVEKDEPARLYQRIGYRVIGEMADARRPAAVPATGDGGR
jgi:GNAT superfamily N-acetyltransferase